jgi:hypothetical protein
MPTVTQRPTLIHVQRYAPFDILTGIATTTVPWAIATEVIGSRCMSANACDGQMFNRLVLRVVTPVSIAAGIVAAILRARRSTGAGDHRDLACKIVHALSQCLGWCRFFLRLRAADWHQRAWCDKYG